MPGSAVAQWMRNVVEATGQHCRDPLQEDCGWGFWLDSGCTIWVAVSYCGIPGDTPAGKPAEWVVSVTHERSLLSPSQWFKKETCGVLADRVFAAIEAAVRGKPEILVTD